MADNFLKAWARKFFKGRPSFQLNGASFGYEDGSTVTQATDKTTAFTLNTVTGRIIFAASALAAFTSSSATWTNSFMGSYDVVAFVQNSGSFKYNFHVVCSDGQGSIVIYNASNGSLTEAVAVSFVLIKGSWS